MNTPFDIEQVLIALKNTPSIKKQLGAHLTKIRKSSISTSDEITCINNIKGNNIDAQYDYGLMKENIHLVTSLLPKATIDRKHIKQIVIENTHWFRAGVTYENMFDEKIFPQGPITAVRAEAASDYSLPCGRTDYIDNNPYACSITMYTSVDYFSSGVLKIYGIYTLLHELGHVFSDAAYYSLYYAKRFLHITDKETQQNTYTLTLPDGSQETGNRYISNFIPLLEKYGPFGTYTAGYTRADNEDLWLREGFADATAAYFMGFMIYPEKDFAPLPDDVQEYIHDFYHATASIEKY